MASSTKMRLSSRRMSTSPPVDEDILASSSAGWKAVALPEPAKMVSLPALDELPPVEEVQKADRKSKNTLKAERTSASKVASAAIAIDTAPVSAAASPAPVAKPAVREIEKSAATPIVGARFGKPQQQKSRTGLYAALGLGLAAAAGVGWYVSTQMNKKTAAPQVAARDSEERAAAPQSNTAPAAVATPTVEPIAPPPAAEPAADTSVATGMSGAASAAPSGGADESKADEAGRGKAKNAVAKGRREDEKKGEVTKPVETKPDPAKDAAKPTDKKAEGGEGEPSFDALLKEAGVQDKKPAKVVLEKKSLSGADIKKGMSALDAKAQSCYAGTQGTASVKLTVTPDGKVEKVAVSGVFAGTPVGACIENAVRGASFPAWDGGPQSFGYSYLLAE